MSSIDAAGLHLDSLTTIVANLTASMQAIYGADINIDPSSPDGQWLNIIAQMVIDCQQLLQQINAMFDPDQAIGVILDQRVGINGIQRQGGTFTITNVTVTNNQSVTLYGVDQSLQQPFVVQDNAGTQWVLQSSIVIPNPVTQALSFQAVNPGAVLSAPNTITVPVTTVLGVVSVNNPTTFTTLGQNEESDAALKIRRQQSVALSSQGYLQGLLAALLNIPGMESAYVYENNTGTTVNGVPGHSIWVITSGAATDAAIANAIYTKRNAGCGMKGSKFYSITQVDGTSFNILWDVVIPEDLFIKFTATPIGITALPNLAAIQSGLVTGFSPSVAQAVNIGALSTAVQTIDPNTLVTLAGFSTTSTGSFVNVQQPLGNNYQFAVQSANIIMLPIILIPGINSGIGSVPSVPRGSTQVYTSVGGYGTYTYSLKTNSSGGSITSVGLYTAGTTGSVVDVVKVVDSLSNTTSVSVSVT